MSERALSMKECVKMVSTSVIKRIGQIYDTDMHPNKKTSELKLIGYGCADELRSNAKSMNTLKNAFAEIRKSISELGLYHHLLDGRIKTLDKEFKSIVTISDMKRMCGDDVNGFAKKIKDRINELKAIAEEKYKIGNSQRGREIMEVADNLLKLKIYPEPYYAFVLTKIERDSVDNRTQTGLDEKISNQVTIGVNSYINLARKLMLDDGWILKSLGLAMLSGRRASEIFVTAKFNALGEDKLIFSGAAKKGALSEALKDDTEHVIDSLIDAHEFVYHFEQFRNAPQVQAIIKECEETDSLTPVNKRASTYMRYHAKRQLPKLNPGRDENDWSFSDTRSMAVAVAYYLDSKKDKKERTEDEVLFYKKYLAHENIETMLHYRAFFVVPDGAENKNKTLLDCLHNAEEDVLRYATRSELSTDRILKAHDRLCDYVSKNPKAKITQALIKKPKKQGGVGAAHDVAVEYLEMIKPHLI